MASSMIKDAINAKCFHWSGQCDCMLADRMLHDSVDTHLCFCLESSPFLKSSQSVEPQPFLCLKLFLFLWRELVSFHTEGTRWDTHIQNTWKSTWSIPKYPYYQNTTFEVWYKQRVDGYKEICLSFSLLYCLNIFVLTSRLIDGAVTFYLLLHCCFIIPLCATLMYKKAHPMHTQTTSSVQHSVMMAEQKRSIIWSYITAVTGNVAQFDMCTTFHYCQWNMRKLSELQQRRQEKEGNASSAPRRRLLFILINISSIYSEIIVFVKRFKKAHYIQTWKMFYTSNLKH